MDLDELARRCERWVDTAFWQAKNRLLYRVDNPGGLGPELYAISHPLFPVR